MMGRKKITINILTDFIGKYSCIGLFQYICGGKTSNIHVEILSEKKTYNSYDSIFKGGICEFAYGGSIENCSTSGK